MLVIAVVTVIIAAPVSAIAVALAASANADTDATIVTAADAAVTAEFMPVVSSLQLELAAACRFGAALFAAAAAFAAC